MATMGRPRQFDRDTALQQAMSLFWQYGYESTSLAQLKQAMGGISAASLYAAFGSKEALYKEAIELYMTTYGVQISSILNNPEHTTKEAISLALLNAAQEQTKGSGPHGCMVVLSATNCSPDNQHIQEAMRAHRANTRFAFQNCLKRGVESGQLLPDTNIASLATYFSTILNGISIQARDGLSLTVLNEIIDVAVMSLTGSPQQAVFKP